MRHALSQTIVIFSQKLLALVQSSSLVKDHEDYASASDELRN